MAGVKFLDGANPSGSPEVTCADNSEYLLKVVLAEPVKVNLQHFRAASLDVCTGLNAATIGRKGGRILLQMQGTEEKGFTDFSSPWHLKQLQTFLENFNVPQETREQILAVFGSQTSLAKKHKS
ncbi:MAG: hypothetical protein PHU71_02680 [Candidatus Gracilibacteria bacterium]|nr:hypothetical protein [Candidatus Gracilibacteria bacterium]